MEMTKKSLMSEFSTIITLKITWATSDNSGTQYPNCYQFATFFSQDD